MEVVLGVGEGVAGGGEHVARRGVDGRAPRSPHPAPVHVRRGRVEARLDGARGDVDLRHAPVVGDEVAVAGDGDVELARPLVQPSVHVLLARVEDVAHGPAGLLLTAGKGEGVNRPVPAGDVHDPGRRRAVDDRGAADSEHAVRHVLAARLLRAEVLLPQHLAGGRVERVEVAVLRALVDDVLRAPAGDVHALCLDSLGDHHVAQRRRPAQPERPGVGAAEHGFGRVVAGALQVEAVRRPAHRPGPVPPRSGRGQRRERDRAGERERCREHPQTTSRHDLRSPWFRRRDHLILAAKPPPRNPHPPRPGRSDGSPPASAAPCSTPCRTTWRRA